MCIGVSFKSTEVLDVVLSSQFRVEYRWHDRIRQRKQESQFEKRVTRNDFSYYAVPIIRELPN